MAAVGDRSPTGTSPTLGGSDPIHNFVTNDVQSHDAEQRERMSRYTDTYLYTDEGWRCVQAQITPLLPEYLTGADTVVSTYLRGVRQDSRQ